jgi:hypothetical protein
VAATPVTLIATPAIGSRFANWVVARRRRTNPTCALPIAAAAVEAAATFADLPTLTLNVVGGGSVVDNDNPATSCDGLCSFDFATPTTVRLSGRGVQADCIGFDGFGGACAGTSVCTLTVNANVTVFAGFSRIPGCIPN